jgi:hypothetical protein
MRPFVGTIESARPYGGYYTIQLTCRTAGSARRYVEITRATLEQLQEKHGDLVGKRVDVSAQGNVWVLQ